MATQAQVVQKYDRLVDFFTPNTGGQSNVRKLQVGNLYHYLQFRLTGNLVVAGAAATLNEDGILNLIKRLEISTNLGTVYKSLTGELAYKRDKYETGTPGRLSQPAVVIGTNAFEVVIPIHFDGLNVVPGDVFALQSKSYKGQRVDDLRFNLLLGTETDVATAGGGGTIALSGLNAYLQAEETTGIDREFLTNFETATIFRQAVNGTAQKLELKTKRLIKRMGFIAETAAGANSDTIISEIRLLANNGTILLRKWKWADLQADNKAFYSLESTETGFALAEFDKTLQLIEGDLIDASQYNDLSLEIDTTAAALFSAELQEVL